MEKNYLYFLCFIFSIPFFSQEVEWQKDITSKTQSFLSQLSITPDQQYLIAGSSIHQEEGKNYGYDFHLIKLNQKGEKVWEKYFGGTEHDFLTATTPTEEGGFLLAGTSFSEKGRDKTESSYGSADLWVIKISESGGIEWQRTLGSTGNEEAKSVVQTTDMGYVVASDVSFSPKEKSFKNIWIIKLNKAGSITHEAILGGKSDHEIEKIIPTKDGGVLVAAYSRDNSHSYLNINETSFLKDSIHEGKSYTKDNITRSLPIEELRKLKTHFFIKNTENFGEGDYWIIKLDKELNLQWQQSFGGKDDDHIRSIQITDSGYILGGESRSEATGNKRTTSRGGSHVWLISLDENGEEQWQQSYRFKNRDILMSIEVIPKDKSKNGAESFLLGGYSQAEGKVEKDEETFWMLYLDKKGNEIWRKYIEGSSRKNEERLVSATMNKEGAYILAGTSAEELGKENWKIVKLKDQQLKELILSQEIRAYPNPAKNYVYIEIGYDFEQANIECFDMSGKKIRSLKTYHRITKMDTYSLPQGVYIINVTTLNPNKIINTKVIKL